MHEALHKPGIKTVLVSKILVQCFESLCLTSTKAFFFFFYMQHHRIGSS